MTAQIETSTEQLAIGSTEPLEDFDISSGGTSLEDMFDRYGRYLIPDIGDPDGTPVARMRSTTFAKHVADTFTLNAWGKRVAGYGLMMDAAAQGTMLREIYRLNLEQDKKKLDAIMERALVLAGGKTGAEIGKRYHSLTEWIDDDRLTEEPEMTNIERADMLAYKTCFVKHRITVVSDYIEKTVLIPFLNVAGTFDRLVWYQGELTVLDLKTGNIDYAEAEICIQLWTYAQAKGIWDWNTRQFLPMPKVRQDYGLVVHLRAGSQKAELHRVPFSRGERGARVAVAVKNYRADPDGLVKIPDPDSPKLTDRLFYAQTRADVQVIWNAATNAQRNQVRFPAAVKAKLKEIGNE